MMKKMAVGTQESNRKSSQLYRLWEHFVHFTPYRNIGCTWSTANPLDSLFHRMNCSQLHYYLATEHGYHYSLISVRHWKDILRWQHTSFYCHRSYSIVGSTKPPLLLACTEFLHQRWDHRSTPELFHSRQTTLDIVSQCGYCQAYWSLVHHWW